MIDSRTKTNYFGTDIEYFRTVMNRSWKVFIEQKIRKLKACGFFHFLLLIIKTSRRIYSIDYRQFPRLSHKLQFLNE